MYTKLAAAAFSVALYLAPYGQAGGGEPVAPSPIATSTAEVAPAASQEPEEPALTPDATLAAICGCESMGDPRATPRQFDATGAVLRGRVNPLDVGMCQINEGYHLEAATALGFDIHTAAGNWGYARHLLATQGTQPWSWSKACWGSEV